MKSYFIDEIPSPDIMKIREFLSENAMQSNLEGIYWMKMPDDILNRNQFEHRECGPHVFAIEIGRDWIKMEFFVRSLKNMRCTCSGFCTTQQRNHVINFANDIIQSLDIST